MLCKLMADSIAYVIHSLIRLGKGGIVVYIPQSWVRANGLHAGDEVGLILLPNALIIRPLSQPQNPHQTH